MGMEEAMAVLEPFTELYFVAGVAACKTAVAPIDRVKLLMQAQGGMLSKSEFKYKGIGNCLMRTVMEEGFASLWRGNAANVARYLTQQAYMLGFWEVCKREMRNNMDFKHDQHLPSVAVQNYIAGHVAGGLSAIGFYPLDYARTRLAMDAKRGGERQFKGLLDLYTKTMAANGIAGFYRGVTMSCIGASLYRGIYFGMYKTLKPVVLTGTKQDSFFGSFGIAWVSSVIAGLASYPFDTLRRRLMVESGENNLANETKLLVHVREKEGIRSLYKHAVGANMLRSVAGAAVLAGYEFCLRKIISKETNLSCYV